MIKFYLLISILLPLSIFAQENEEEIPIEEQRNNAIKALLQTVEINKNIYVADDQKRINKFLDLIKQRTKLVDQVIANKKYKKDIIDKKE